MKHPILLTAVLLSLSVLAQEVPNGGFEEWESTPQFTLDPVDWETDNTQLVVSTSQDTEPYNGQYAMRVVPINEGVGEFGQANTTVVIGGLPDGLTFYVKYERTVTASVGVEVIFYNGEDQMYYEYWYAPDTVSGWEAVDIPFEPIDIATTHAVIRVFVAIGDLVAGEGWISVDGMNWGLMSTIAERYDIEVELFPNPAKAYVEIIAASDLQIDEIQIIDIQGRILHQVPFDRILDVSQLAAGQYSLSLLKDGERIGQQPLLIEH